MCEIKKENNEAENNAAIFSFLSFLLYFSLWMFLYCFEQKWKDTLPATLSVGRALIQKVIVFVSLYSIVFEISNTWFVKDWSFRLATR